MVKTIVAGSRYGFDEADVQNAIIDAKEHGISIDYIISGGAIGVDRHAINLAIRHGIPHCVIEAEWDKYGNSAGYIRNEEMAKVAQALVAVWDGKSKGTKHMIDTATKKGLKVYVYEDGKAS